ncbi:helix-turn-helix transcriptional regulator [Streptomyces sp. UNOB3_S3]|uniref:helix-turn-helix transcriptional regulator n=1 Tax=Streptomyces sp. UNOB3_S3 TaxID=2871682 RepID=UPI001E2E582B|nr:helix-turn-helix transcriptional regulator [Streptomyces sp. UNOB3_S3]MCC3775583.1 helix-turn-helix transcriptional regulator [Streptomyces sp. UNOB3_S3]
MSGLHARDYERMLDLVMAVMEHDDPDSVWHLMAGHLQEALGCDTVIFAGIRLAERTGYAQGWAPDSMGPAVSDVIRRRVQQRHPLIAYMEAAGADPVSITQICDNWRNSSWYSEARRDYGTTHQLGVPLLGFPGELRAVSLGRRGDFTAHELAFTARVQPLLLRADRHVRELHRLRGAATTPAGGPSPPRHDLTPRELTVLGLLAEGLTAAGIGRRLTISPHTVNRHLEKVYRKLGTNNRVSAVLAAKRAGIVP